MRLGFSGSRRGWTDAQLRVVWLWLKNNHPDEIHHGNCLGGDELFSVACVNLAEHVKVVPYEIAHPCNIAAQQLKDGLADEFREPKPPLERNRDIVDETEMLLATPHGPEERRSGTWSTIRYGRKLGRRIVIVWPDGSITEEPQREVPALLSSPSFRGGEAAVERSETTII